MIERTEELGLSARLPIVVGGQTVELRTLNLDESDKWLAKFGKLEVEADMPTQPMLELVIAYDVEHVLGPSASLRKRITKVELHNALNQMVRAEAPFEEAARSVVAASGTVNNIPGSLMYHLIVRSLRASSTSGVLPIGDSTPDNSDESSPRNGSSSSGPMVNGASNGRHRSKASSTKSRAPTPISTQP